MLIRSRLLSIHSNSTTQTSDVEKLAIELILLKQKLAPIAHHSHNTSKNILPTSIRSSGCCRVLLADIRVFTNEPWTIGNTNFWNRTIFRLDPPKPLPVGNPDRIKGVVAEDFKKYGCSIRY
jgi:hypothetical protein